MKVRLTKEQKIKVLNCDDVYLVMQEILLRENKIRRDKEHFWVLCLSNSNTILLIELISLGNVKATLVDPMEVFSFALQKRAVKIILVHNHPSGELQPSAIDIDLTDRMYQAGLFLQVPVIDHIIIDEKAFYSFADSGLLSKLSKSEKYVLPFKKEETRIENRGVKKGMKEGVKKGEMRKAVEMAKEMKKDGRTTEEIMKYTKLSKKQIEEL